MIFLIFFTQASGQMVNKDKSAIFFSASCDDDQEEEVRQGKLWVKSIWAFPQRWVGELRKLLSICQKKFMISWVVGVKKKKYSFKCSSVNLDLCYELFSIVGGDLQKDNKLYLKLLVGQRSG